MRASRLPYSLSQTLMRTGRTTGTIESAPTTNEKKADLFWPSTSTLSNSATKRNAHKFSCASALMLLRLSSPNGLMRRLRERGAGVSQYHSTSTAAARVGVRLTLP